jgi:hypothetical protein
MTRCVAPIFLWPQKFAHRETLLSNCWSWSVATDVVPFAAEFPALLKKMKTIEDAFTQATKQYIVLLLPNNYETFTQVIMQSIVLLLPNN